MLSKPDRVKPTHERLGRIWSNLTRSFQFRITILVSNRGQHKGIDHVSSAWWTGYNHSRPYCHHQQHLGTRLLLVAYKSFKNWIKLLSLSLSRPSAPRERRQRDTEERGGRGRNPRNPRHRYRVSLSLPSYLFLASICFTFFSTDLLFPPVILLLRSIHVSVGLWTDRESGPGGDAWRWLPSGFSRSSRISRRASIRLAAQVSRIPMLPLHYPFTASFSHILINM